MASGHKPSDTETYDLFARDEELEEKEHSGVGVDISCLPFFNYALAYLAPTPLRSILIENDTAYDIVGLTIVVDSKTDLLVDTEIQIEAIPAGETLEIDGSFVHVDVERVLQLTELMTDELKFDFVIDGTVVYESVKSIDFFAFDQWLGDRLPETLAAFVTPNHPALSQVIVNASKYLEEWTGNPAFDGYQSGDPNRARMQAAALYRAVQEWGIVYVGAPANYTAGQRIRMPDAVLDQHMATCLDFTVLYAALLEAVRLRPLIVLIDGHAFPGVWLEESSFPELVETDCASLTKRCASGIEQMTVLQSTDMAQGKDVPFEKAERTGRDMLDPTEFLLAIDVHRAHVGGVLPLPVRVMGDRGWTVDANQNVLSDVQAPTAKETSKEFIDVVDVPRTKQQLWERSLLDLSMRNNLLNMRPGPRALPIFVPALDEVEDALAMSNELIVAPRPSEFPNLSEDQSFTAIDLPETAKSLLYAEFKDGRLRTPFTQTALKRNLDNLYRSAKSAQEETGANTLFLALGLLKWIDSKRNSQVRLAPIMLFPVEIIRKSAKAGYVIRLKDDEPQINISLIEMLRADYGIHIDGLDPLPLDEAGVDTRLVLNTFVNKVLDQKGWEVFEAASIGLFSFSQFVMWNDIRLHEKDLRKSKVVDSMIEGRLVFTPTMLDPEEPVDPSELLLPVEADASQMYAIKAALEGNTFVLHGPPGTGKSQTITAIIANAMARGQKVLFVAEKMAALEVVERRLSALGLSPFCLEVHSAKATRNHVLEQVQTAIEAKGSRTSERYSLKMKEIRCLREQLDNYALGLRSKDNSGLTLREQIAAHAALEDECEAMPIGAAFVDGLQGPSDFTEKMNYAERVITLAKDKAPLKQHPLHGVTGTSCSQATLDKLPSILANCKVSVENANCAAAVFAAAIGLPLPKSFEEFDKLSAFSQHVSRVGALDSGWVQAIGNASLISQFKGLIAQAELLKERRINLLKTRHESFLELDVSELYREWNEAQSKGFFGRNKVIAAFVAKLNAHMKTPLDANQIDAALIGLGNYQRAVSELEGVTQAADGYLAPFRQFDGSYDWDAIKKRVEYVAQAGAEQQELARLLVNMGDISGALDAGKRYGELWQQSQTALAELEQGIGAVAITNGQAWSESVIEFCDVLACNSSMLHDWMAWNRTAGQANEMYLGDLIDYLQENAVSDTTTMGFIRGVYHALCVHNIDALSGMNSFTTEDYDQLIRQYARADKELRELAREQIYCEVAARMPDLTALSATDTAAAKLQKRLRSRGRSVSIRSIISESGDVIRELCPCFLMSPLSVSQYLEPGKQKFDLLIFDEASQLQTCKAVGALARAKNAVIVGDPRQMPPTSFFQGKVTGEDYEEASDLESVLEDCLALNLPQTYLKWHYRSRHESLIAFSNKRFYESKMYTFPSADDQRSHVEFVRVDGYFDRGGKRVNEAEAKAIVDDLVRRAKDSKERAFTVGVVTFNIPQQSLIEDLLQEAFLDDPTFEEWATTGSEPLFVKNLENVQGDERDVVLFSITYAPDARGRMSMNFGPINREGGWRRLNVAVTRARSSMKVFSSMLPSDIDLNRTSSLGPSSLKAFLTYAQKGTFEVATSGDKQSRPANDAIASALCARLEQLGYKTHRNVGRSAYRVDIAVLDPFDSTRYLAGILLDGDTYTLAETTRDREVSQPALLSGLGWKIYRLWALEWWNSPDAAVQNVVRFLGELEQEARLRAPKAEAKPGPEGRSELDFRPESEVKSELDSKPEPDSEAGQRTGLEYRPASEVVSLSEAQPCVEPGDSDDAVDAGLAGSGSGPLAFQVPYGLASMDPEPLEAEEFAGLDMASVVQTANQILLAEAPIEQSLLVKRIASHYGLSRVGKKIQEKCELAVKKSACKKVMQAGRAILWLPNQDPKTYLVYRVSRDEASRRDLLELPHEEIVAAAVECLRKNGEMEQGELIKAAVTLLGYKRVTGKMSDFAKKAMTLGVRRGLIERNGGSLSLAAVLSRPDDEASVPGSASAVISAQECATAAVAAGESEVVFEPTDFVFLDVETPNRHQNSICQIGVIRTGVDYKVKATLSSLVNPDAEFDFKNTSIHGIKAGDVVHAPTFDQLWASDLCSIVSDARLVGHNLKFDLNVLDKLFARYGIERGEVTYACTFSLAGECFPELENYKLETVCDRCGVQLERHHDAYSDAKACMGVFSYLDRRYGIAENAYSWSSFVPAATRQKEAARYAAPLSASSKEMNELILLAEDVVDDGKVTLDEAIGLRWWIERNPILGNEGISENLLALLNEVLLDGVIDEDEERRMLQMLKQIVDPLACCEAEIVSFDGKRFCLTGDFDFGSKQEVERALAARGGMPLKSVTKKCDYVIVGNRGSDRYAFGNYGGKVAKALDMQERGYDIKVIREADIGL